MAHRFPFTSAVLDSLIPPRVGFEVVRDSYNPELQLYITANGAKTFFVRKRFRGKDVRKILGKYPDIDIDDARDAADDAVKKMHEPIPVRSGSISLKKMADNFLKNKVKRAPDSMRKLERQIARLLADILPLKLSEITPDTLSGAHLKIAMTNGKSTANRLKETISAIFNMAIEEGYVKTNPARGLEKFPEKKGARFISPGEFLALGNAIEEEKNATMRAAMKMLIYGFANKSRILAMRWDDLDMNQNTWNKRPLTDQAIVLLESLPQKSKFVFPNTGGKSGHLVDPKRAWQRVLLRAGLHEIKITDIYKTLRSQVKHADGRIREQMNDALDRLRV